MAFGACVGRRAVHAAAAFEATVRFAVVREKVFHCAEQIRPEPPAFLCGIGDSPTGQHLREESVREVTGRISIPQLATEERGHRFVVGVAQFAQRPASFR